MNVNPLEQMQETIVFHTFVDNRMRVLQLAHLKIVQDSFRDKNKKDRRSWSSLLFPIMALIDVVQSLGRLSQDDTSNTRRTIGGPKSLTHPVFY